MEILQQQVLQKEGEIMKKQEEINSPENKVIEMRKQILGRRYLKETKITIWEQIYHCMKGFKPYLDYFSDRIIEI